MVNLRLWLVETITQCSNVEWQLFWIGGTACLCRCRPFWIIGFVSFQSFLELLWYCNELDLTKFPQFLIYLLGCFGYNGSLFIGELATKESREKSGSVGPSIQRNHALRVLVSNLNADPTLSALVIKWILPEHVPLVPPSSSPSSSLTGLKLTRPVSDRDSGRNKIDSSKHLVCYFFWNELDKFQKIKIWAFHQINLLNFMNLEILWYFGDLFGFIWNPYGNLWT